MDFSVLERRVGVTFKDVHLLTQAFTHQSSLIDNQHSLLEDNERLEFLGDAVLQLIVTNYLFKKYTDKDEGDLTKYRAALVNTHTLAICAAELGIDEFLLFPGDIKNINDRKRENILCDTLEAFIGAMYLDRGLRITEHFVVNHLLCKTDEYIRDGLLRNSKGRLQQIAHSVFKIEPTYKVLRKVGPVCDAYFVVGVYLGSNFIAEGWDKSKKIAEVKAARAALERMQKNKFLKT